MSRAQKDSASRGRVADGSTILPMHVILFLAGATGAIVGLLMWIHGASTEASAAFVHEPYFSLWLLLIIMQPVSAVLIACPLVDRVRRLWIHFSANKSEFIVSMILFIALLLIPFFQVRLGHIFTVPH